MNTITQFLGSINWVDVVVLIVLIRTIFIGVKTGFVTELFKLTGIFIASFVSLHFYLTLATWAGKKVNISLSTLEFVFFTALVCLTVLVIKFLRDLFFIIFKFESTHAGLNQWGGGALSIIRAFFLASLIMYGLLLTRLESVQRQTLTSISHKVAMMVAPNTYSFVYHEFVGKIFSSERFNEEVNNVTSRNTNARKPF